MSGRTSVLLNVIVLVVGEDTVHNVCCQHVSSSLQRPFPWRWKHQIGRENVHMLLIELKHFLWASLSAGRQPRLTSIEAPIVVLLIPDQICPELAAVVLFDRVDLRHQWVPGIVIRRWRLPCVGVDVSVAGREVVVGGIVILKRGGALTAFLLLFLGRFDGGAGGLATSFLAGRFCFLDCRLGLATDLLPVRF